MHIDFGLVWFLEMKMTYLASRKGREKITFCKVGDLNPCTIYSSRPEIYRLNHSANLACIKFTRADSDWRKNQYQ